MRTAGIAVVLSAVRWSAIEAQELTRDGAVTLATAELARTLGVAAATIALVDATAMQWPDSSLGCRERGMTYRAVITPGFRVTLRAAGRHYSMHVGGGRAIECGTPVRGDARDGKTVRSNAAAGLKLAEQARDALAARLGVARDRVVIDRFRPVTWPDARLGCASAPGAAPPAPQPTPGYLIELIAAGVTYEYHSDLTRVAACETPANQ
jgi:hypothetical protein